MKKIDAHEAYRAIISLVEVFTHNTAVIGCRPMEGVIPEVRFADIVMLYRLIGNQNKKFYMPCEHTHHRMVIEYNPVPHVTILVMSEVCQNYKPNINLINYN